MGKISRVIIDKSSYKMEDYIKEYWYQNSPPDIDTYEKYKKDQKRIRDIDIKRCSNGLNVKMDSVIITPSINGGISIIGEII